MSADIWLESADGDKLDFGEEEIYPMRRSAKAIGNNFNLTYNLTPMLVEAGMQPWKEFIGLTAFDAAFKWAVVVDELKAHPDKYKAMNPINGWGDYDGAVEVLSALVDACKAHPNAKIGGWL